MTRPRIEGMDEKIMASFIERNIYSSSKEVISAALRALVREQKQKEAQERESQAFLDETYALQFDDQEGKENETMGNLVRQTAVR